MELLNNSTFDVNYQFGRAQRTLLHSAANTGAFESLLFLLKKGAQVNVIDRIGITPLHLAARNGHKKCVQKLVESGADIGIHDNEGLTALHWLACNGRTELLLVLLQRGELADVVDIHGHTSLHHACQNGHIKCAEKLLEFNADLNKANNEGRTPLFFACRHGQLKCVKLLLNKGALIVPDKNGVSLIDICAESGYKECIELILLTHPDQVDKLVNLVKQDQVPLSQMQLILEYLCNSNIGLMVTIVTYLATLTATAGMELLSVNSSYKDLMPQFLRCIKMLCLLYPYYKQALVAHGQSASSGGSPASAATRRVASQRSDSLGGYADTGTGHARLNPNPRARSFLNSWTGGHRRSGSSPEELETPKAIEMQEDPFDKLEMIWYSLETWFDLLLKEVEKLSEKGSKESSPINGGMNDSTSSDTSQLAAAIILSAPPERREVFLKPSISFEQSLPQLDEKRNWRRSWHADRYVRVTPLAEEVGGVVSTSSLPSYNRSKSSEISSNEKNSSSAVPTDEHETALTTATSDRSSESHSSDDQWNPNIVDAYADRLGAVTHAFSLCCKVETTAVSLSKETGSLRERFQLFVNKYDPVLKILLARNPQLIFAHFHFLLESTELLARFIHIVHAQPFEDRKKWFYENLYGDKPPSQELTLQTNEQEIIVDREEIFRSSCTKIVDAPVRQLKDSLIIRFEGEAGMGSGVYREWFNNLSAEILNPDYALFTQSSDGATFQPNSHSDVNPDHLSYFKFAGRTMSLALYHKQLLSVYFTRSFYKHILGIAVSYHDVESIDPEYANNLQWLLDNKIDELDLGLTFSVETDVFGATELIELLPNGSQVIVTDENKAEYVQLVTEMRMTQAIGPQIKAFTDGFYEIIPHHLISLFNEYELELLMSGLPDIDIADWEKNTEYTGYTCEQPVIKWFWEVVSEYDKKELAVLLQFVTGSSRVPLGGFANLVGASGITKFTISHLEYRPNRLPMASTCFNLLKLPEYTHKEMLQERMKFALTCGTGLIDIT